MSKNKKKKWYYAVGVGREIGIYNTWDECEAQVKGYSGALFKKFDDKKSAWEFIEKCQSSVY